MNKIKDIIIASLLAALFTVLLAVLPLGISSHLQVEAAKERVESEGFFCLEVNDYSAMIFYTCTKSNFTTVKNIRWFGEIEIVTFNRY